MLSTFQITSVHMWLAPSVLNSTGSITKVDGCTFHYKQKVVLGMFTQGVYSAFGRNPRATPFISVHLYTGQNQYLQGPQTGQRGGMVCSPNTVNVLRRVRGISNILSQPRGLTCQ